MDTGISPPLNTLTNNNPINSIFSLSDSRYDFNYAKYPLQIDDINGNGHYMNFYINVMDKSSYLETYSTTFKKDGKEIDNTYSIPQSSGLFGIKKVTGNAIPIKFKSVTGLTGDFGSQGPNRNFYKRIRSAISLFVPYSQMAFVTSAEWEDMSETKVFGGALAGLQFFNDVGSAARSAVDSKTRTTSGFKTLSSDMNLSGYTAAGIQNLITAVLQSTKIGTPLGSRIEERNAITGMAGIAVNPQLLVLYKQTKLRSFSFSFVMIPSNETEARNIKNIIKMFRFHAAPEATYGSGRFYFAPSTFDIEVFHKGRTNDSIPKISTCALTSINVNYSPRGWATFVDGTPVVTTMELHFTEMDIMTKQKIEAGF